MKMSEEQTNGIDDGGREIKQSWGEFKKLVEDLDLDAVKNAGGTASAGVRFRKGLRDLKKKAGQIVKATVALDKSRREAAKANGTTVAEPPAEAPAEA
jgi:hypothetical protein